MTYFKKSICPYDCMAACGLNIETDGKKVISVSGDPEHPIFKGIICHKMRHYERAINSPDRILTPLKRVGKKGSGEFVPVSWEEAVKDITDRWKDILDEFGPDAFIGISSSGNQGPVQRSIVEALMNKIGARKMMMTLCTGAFSAARKTVYGGFGASCPTELPLKDFYLVWGNNMKSTRIHTLPILQEERKKGKKIVLIEVCAEDSGKYCDEVVLVKPGSDGALALAMMHVLVEEGLTADDYLEAHAVGFKEFKATLTQYTPEWAEAITGVKAEIIREIALEYGRAKAPLVLCGYGLSRRGNGGMNTRLITILSGITGAWGKPGGGFIGGNPNCGPALDVSLVSRPDLRTHHGLTANITMLAEELAADAEHPVKAFYMSGGNPASSVHNQKKILESLSREDLFTVVHERVMSDTALYADYILPATYSVEDTNCRLADGYTAFGTSYKVVEPAGEAKSNWNTISALAAGMGYEDDHFKMTEEEMLQILLEHPGKALMNLTDEEMKILREGGFVRTPYADHINLATSDGKFHIVDDTIEEPMPRYIEDFDDRYPLNLVAVPDFFTLNSTFFERKELVEKRGPMTVMLNPEDAAVRGIETGDKVIVSNDLAEIEFLAYVTPNVAKGCAASKGTYDRNQTGHIHQISALHHTRVADMGGGTTLNGNRVEIRKK